MVCKHGDTINRQRQNVPLLVADKPLFKEIKRKITHEALNLLLREWISVGKMVESLTISNKSPPDIQHNTCKKECPLSIQYGLPCKFFLFYCLVEDEVISLSLIHPRWFFDGPPYITRDSWRMQYSDFCDNDEPLENDLTRTLVKKGDRYQDHGMTLVEESAVTSLDYAKALPAYEQEECVKAFPEFNSLFQNRRTKHAEVPTTFVDPIRPKDVKLKKGKRRGLSLRKALEEEETEKQRQRQAESIGQARLERHNVLSQFQINVENLDLLSSQGPNLSDHDLLDRPEFNSDVPDHESEDNRSNDDVQYLKTQARSHSAISHSSFSSRKSRHSSRNLTPSLEMNDSD